MSKLAVTNQEYPAWLGEQLSSAQLGKVAQSDQIVQWRRISERCLLIQNGEQTLKVKYAETPAESYVLQCEALWLNRLNRLELTSAQCIDFYKNGQQSYLLTHYIPGLSSNQWFRAQVQHRNKAQDDVPPQTLNQLSPEDQCRLAVYLESVLNHIEAIHRHHLVHGDIKPSNMIFGTDNPANLIDFSNMRRVGEPWQERGFLQFSPSFVHPNQSLVATKGQDYYAYLLSLVALYDSSQIPHCKTISGLSRVIEDNSSQWHIPDEMKQRLMKLLPIE